MADTISYKYGIKFADGRVYDYDVVLDSVTLDLAVPRESDYPDWAKLEEFRCSNCTLDPGEHDFCPVAVSLDRIIEDFRDSISYESVDITIASKERNFYKKTSLQQALNSLMGILMVTSGCPVLGKLKPMVRLHQPFSTLYERKYRVLTMYLMAQYFLYKKGAAPDWDLNGLMDIFEQIRIVNQNFCRRLCRLKVKDAAVNALVALDSFANYASILLSADMPEDLEPAFNEYFDESIKERGEGK